MNTIEYRGQVFDRSHGSPFDRGAADSWYSRPQEPHWYPEGTYRGKRIESKDKGLRLKIVFVEEYPW
jgi:hypothetical protein